MRKVPAEFVEVVVLCTFPDSCTFLIPWTLTPRRLPLPLVASLWPEPPHLPSLQRSPPRPINSFVTMELFHATPTYRPLVSEHKPPNFSHERTPHL